MRILGKARRRHTPEGRMIEAQERSPKTSRTRPRLQLKVWHLALLVLFVAIAIADIQDQRTHDPVLIALASAGFVLYGVLCVLAWRFFRRFEGKLGPAAAFVLFAVAMAALFLMATVIYVYLEVAYYRYW
jgi:hypothetical protein